MSTLAGIVAMFYKAQVADFKAAEAKSESKIRILEQRVDECEVDRMQLKIDHAVLKTSYATLEKRVSDLEVNKQNRDSV